MNETWNLTLISKFNTVLLCVVNVMFTFVGVFLNSVVIMSLLNSQLRRKICYFMILVLAFFDLLVVLVFHPLITVKTLLSCRMFEGHNSLQLINFLYVFSLTTLLTMAVERYLALMYPFCHQKYMTKSKLIAVFFVFQLPFGALHILRLNMPDDYIESATMLSIIGIFVFVLLGLNLKVFYLARKIRQRVDITLGSMGESEQNNIERKKCKLTSAASLGKMSTCSLAALCLFICYCPALIILLFELTGNPDWSHPIWCVINLWTETLVTLNSSLNCLIFFYRNSTLWFHGKKILKKCFCSTTRFHE